MSVYDYIVAHLQVTKEHGAEVHAVCPWCGDGSRERGKFQFNVEKTVGRCWRASCDVRASLTKLIAKIENIPPHLAARKAAKLKQEDGHAPIVFERKEYEAVGSLPGGAIPLNDIGNVFDSLTAEEKQIVESGVLYLTERRHVDFELLASRNVAIGLAGRWKGRVLFPATEEGQIVSLTARAIEIELPGFIWMRYPDIEGEKYIHPNNDSGYLEKGWVLYGLDDARQSEVVVVVEDVFSVFALRTIGFNAISPWGVNLTDEQLAKLDNKWVACDRKAIVMLDSDAAVAAMKMAKRLGRICQPAVATLPGADADEDLDGALDAIKNANHYSVVDEIESLLL